MSCELPRLTVIARPHGHVAGTPADQGMLLRVPWRRVESGRAGGSATGTAQWQG
jgi:hypothetical protein